MMVLRRVTAAMVVFSTALAASGCSRSPRVTFYTLAAAPAPEGAVSPPMHSAIAVGPVTLPEMVDRPQLVLRVAANRVEILESHRWAESLKFEVPQVIAQNLSRQLRSDRVSAYPQNAGNRAEFMVLVDVRRFEAVAGEGVTVDALWSVRRTTAAAAKTGNSSVTDKVPAGSGYEAIAAAYSRALASVSADIARVLAAMMRDGDHG